MCDRIYWNIFAHFLVLEPVSIEYGRKNWLNIHKFLVKLETNLFRHRPERETLQTFIFLRWDEKKNCLSTNHQSRL